MATSLHPIHFDKENSQLAGKHLPAQKQHLPSSKRAFGTNLTNQQKAGPGHSVKRQPFAKIDPNVNLQSKQTHNKTQQQKKSKTINPALQRSASALPTKTKKLKPDPPAIEKAFFSREIEPFVDPCVESVDLEALLASTAMIQPRYPDLRFEDDLPNVLPTDDLDTTSPFELDLCPHEWGSLHIKNDISDDDDDDLLDSLIID